MTNSELVIEDLRRIAQRPNGLDPAVLLRIQETIAVQVMQQYRAEFQQLLEEQRKNGMPEDQARYQRHAFFYAKLNQEYRNRAANGGQFSLPMYLEAAEAHYRVEVRRLLQQIHDYIAHASRVSEDHLVNNLRDMRNADPKMDDLARAVAGGINGVMRAFNRLSSLGDKVAKKYVDDLKSELQTGLFALSQDRFAKFMIREAETLAEANRELENLQSSDRRPS